MISGSHDHILVYARKLSSWARNLLPRSEEQLKAFKNPDKDPRGPWQSVSFSVQSESTERRKQYRYEVTLPSGRRVLPPVGRHWNGLVSRFESLRKDNRIWFGKDGDSLPREKVFLSEVQGGIVPDTWWEHKEFGNNQDAKKELNRIMKGIDVENFTTPKPVKLIQRILQVATDRDSIVLDSFAGSGTTAHAVLKQNAEDGGDRKFVLVEMEDYADTLTAERVRRVIRGEGGQPFLGDETGFDFYELGEELFTEAGDDINPEIKREALGRFALFLETGVAAESVAENGAGYVESGAGKDVYLFYAPGGTTTFGEEELARLPDGGGERVVYADRCAVDEEELAARGVTFRKIPRDMRDLISRFEKGGGR